MYKNNVNDSKNDEKPALTEILEEDKSEIPELNPVRMMPQFDNQESDLSLKLQFKNILTTIEKEFKMNDYNSWLKASSKVEFLFELLAELKQ